MADEMRAYDPTMRERMASALQGGMEGLGVNRYKARKNAQTVMGGESSNLPAGVGIADFVPFVGTAMGVEEGARDLGKAGEAVGRGDYIDAAAETAGAAAGLLPGGHSTFKTGKNMLKKIRTMKFPELKPIGTQSVPKKQSLKEWAMAGGGVPSSHKDRAEVWHKKAHKYAAGGEVFNSVPDMADGGDIIPGPAYAGGGAVKKAVKGAIEGMVEGIQKILPSAEREANKAKFLEPSAEKRRMYHGTQADVNAFYPSRKGVFVTPEPEFAGDFATSASGQHGPNTMPVRVQVRNPFDYENKAHIDALKQHASKRFPGKGMQGTIDAMSAESPVGNWMYLEDRDVQRSIKDLGHDAYYVDENGVKNLGIYDPKRIKSDIGNRGTYDINSADINEAKGGAIHMAKGGGVKGAVKAGLKKLFGEAPAGVEPIVVRTPEERAVLEKFGQKQEQEAVRTKKVEKAARAAATEPEAQAKPVKSTGRREKVAPDVYRKMAAELGDEAVLKAARAGEHLKPTASGYTGFPRTVTSPQGLGAMRRAIDQDFIDSVEAVRLADPERLGTWYDRAKKGIAESTEPYQLPRTLEQHGVYSAGVSPESELGFSLKHLNTRVAGEPGMAYRGAPMRTLDTAVAGDRPAKMGFKIGEYAEKNDPRVANEGLFGVNDFRRAQGMGYTDPQGKPWKAGVSETMHPAMDAETALQVERANIAGTGGRSDWAGPHIQEVPWVYGKAQDLYGRGKRGRYGGDELEGIKSAIQDANNTARDYMYKHAASATHEAIPGASLGHVRQALDMTPEEKMAYGQRGRWDQPAPEMALSDLPDVGEGNRDIIYGAAGYRQLPSREASGLYINKLGGVETNPMTIARPLMDYPTGGGGLMAPESRKMMDTAEQFRALMDAQEAGAYNLLNTMAGVKGKTSMVMDTRAMNPDQLADPTAGVLPTSEQLAKMSDVMGEQGYGVTSTNRGAVAFPFDPSIDPAEASKAMRKGSKALQEIYPSSQQKSMTTTGYVPGVGKRSAEGPLSTAPFSGEATSDMLKAFSEMHPSVSQNLSESEAIRAAIREKALRDAQMGGTRKDIQETRRFFSEADWPKAVEMIRKGMTPAAALAALGYSASSMAGEKR
jgi:hypothetical protein